MKPILTVPIHDIDGRLFGKLKKGLEEIKEIFEKTVISVTWPTQERMFGEVGKLKDDDFFEVILNEKESVLCDHFVRGYKKAAETAKEGQVIHLATIDRILWQLVGHKEEFKKAITESENINKPVLYVRSKKAWGTHPKNYWAIESMVDILGEKLFGRYLDFCYCQIGIRKEELAGVLPKIGKDKRNFLFCGELILGLLDRWEVVETDWLSWEDPYIFNKDKTRLMLEMEMSDEEDKKRLAYTLPMANWLLKKSKGNLE